MKNPNRKVLKIGMSMSDFKRFVAIKEELELDTIAETLTKLLDCFYKNAL